MPTLSTYASTLLKVAWVTATYWLVGILPEENHSKKGDAWARVRAYRWAAWHFRKYLQHSDDSYGRASLAWCYMNLGMLESSRQHYRVAFAKSNQADIGCALLYVELELGNPAGAHTLLRDIASRRDELSAQSGPLFQDLESRLADVAFAENPPPVEEQTETVSRKTSTNHATALSTLRAAGATFAVSFFGVNALFFLGTARHTPAHFITLCWVSLLAGVVFTTGLLANLAVLTALRRLLNFRLSTLSLIVLGILLLPVQLAMYFSVFAVDSPREIWGELSVWARLPGGSIARLVPFVLGSVVFSVFFGRTHESSKSQ